MAPNANGRLGVPAAAAFWVGGRSGRLLHGDAGAIAARIERTSASARALGQQIDELAGLLDSVGAPRGDAADNLRERVAHVHGALAELDAASRSTILAMMD